MSKPCFVLERDKLAHNLQHLHTLSQKTGVHWLFTLKAFDAPEALKMISQTLHGFSIGNLTEEAKVAPYPTHRHSYAPVFYEEEMITLAQQSQTLSFNSLAQWHRYAPLCREYCSLGLRINPQLSLKQPSYCDSNHSRLGVRYRAFLSHTPLLEGLEGLHFHPFCYQNADALEQLFTHIEYHYASLLPSLQWLNLGGGQQFTSKSYDTEHFIHLVNAFQTRYPHLKLYFEPASAVLHQCGYFQCKVMDMIPHEETTIVILNTSIETHLLDVAITHYLPSVQHTSTHPTPYHYTLAGMSCIAGDTIGTYYFTHPLAIGDSIIFENMLAYTLVKQTHFNGLAPAPLKVI